MKRTSLNRTVLGLMTTAALGCATVTPPPAAPAPVEAPKPVALTPQQSADAFLASYFEELAAVEKASSLAYWTAANSGKPQDWDAYAKAEIAKRMLHNDATRYAQVQKLLASRAELAPLTVRALEIAELSFKEQQVPKALLEQMVNDSSAIEQIFKTFRPEVGGKRLTNNDLLEVLSKETTSAKRQQAWEASKAVGGQVADKLVALAKLRNQAARAVGYENYWDMQVRLQEHDPDTLLAVFSELEKLTDKPFADMKARLDAEQARKYHVKPAALMPWHYDDPFFQAAPPMKGADLDLFFKGMSKEQVVELATRFYADIGLDITDVAARSDLYDREGKDQHAFCITIDRGSDIRTLLNVKPTEKWMDTMLHEMGHALYYKGIDKTLPYNLRESAHIFTTEGVAMMFGALGKNPLWLTTYAKADAKQVKKVESAVLEQRRREQLIFVRWGLVMLNFERGLYQNPEQDLDKLWYDLVERYQGLKRPAGRHGDWASKPHFTMAPVYYHNYVLGELFAAQLRAHFAKMANHTGAASALSFNGRKEFGVYLQESVFKPGMALKWTDFVKTATGQPLSPAAFAAEVR